MTDNLYSSKSDVWAFGVVLWEICTLGTVYTSILLRKFDPTKFSPYCVDLHLTLLGGFPYADVSDAQLMTHLLSGNRLARPENVSEKLQVAP